MPLNKFIPLSPDPNITRDSDMGMAQFGHLNTIVDYLNTYVAADSLQLDGTGPLSATARYITDSAGNLSSLAISTTRVGIGTVTPLVPLDITGNTNLTGILSVGNYVNATGFGQRIRVIGQGDASVGIYRNQASASAAKLEFMKSRGTYDAPVVVNAGDLLGNVGYFGYNGTSYSSSAAISSGVLSTSATGVEADVRFILYNNTGGNFNTMRLTKEGVGIGNALDYIPSATLQVRGSGSTSATTSLLVQNSGGTQLAILNDAGQCIIGTGTPSTHRLEVTGTTRLNGNVTCDANITLVAGSSVLSCGIIRIGNGLPTANIYTDNTKPISMFPTAGTESFRLFENGNLLLQQGGTFTDVPSSKCTINSTTQGFLKPRLTTAQKNAIVSPTAGLEVYDTDLNRPCFYSGSAWVTL